MVRIKEKLKNMGYPEYMRRRISAFKPGGYVAKMMSEMQVRQDRQLFSLRSCHRCRCLPHPRLRHHLMTRARTAALRGTVQTVHPRLSILSILLISRSISPSNSLLYCASHSIRTAHSIIQFAKHFAVRMVRSINHSLHARGTVSLTAVKHVQVAIQIGDTVLVHGGLRKKHVSYGIDRLNVDTKRWLLHPAAEKPDVIDKPDSPVWTRLYSVPSPTAKSFLELEDVLTVRRCIQAAQDRPKVCITEAYHSVTFLRPAADEALPSADPGCTEDDCGAHAPAPRHQLRLHGAGQGGLAMRHRSVQPTYTGEVEDGGGGLCRVFFKPSTLRHC